MSVNPQALDGHTVAGSSEFARLLRQSTCRERWFLFAPTPSAPSIIECLQTKLNFNCSDSLKQLELGFLFELISVFGGESAQDDGKLAETK